MGQKINPQSYRVGVTKNWPVRWFFSGKNKTSGVADYKTFLQEDEVIRRIVKEKIEQAGIAACEIERTSNSLKIMIKAARPGFVIGRGGKGIEELTKALESALKQLAPERKSIRLSVDVEELKRTEVSATYVAQQVAWDLERRLPFRQAMRKHMEEVMQNREAKGVKFMLKGRLDGAEIARREWKTKGALPLQTLRADIDYGTATALTTFGTIGIKVWVYKGEVFKKPSTK